MAYRIDRFVGKGTRKKGGKRTRQGQVVKNTYKIAKLQSKLGQAEVKFFDKVIDQTQISATGIMASQLFTLSEGDSQSQRHGRKVHLTSIQWNGVVTLESTNLPAHATDTVRLLILRDRQANRALPGITDILVQPQWESYRNLENKSRFSIIYEKRISLYGAVSGDGSLTITSPVEKNFRMFRKLNIPILYNDSANTGVIATINSNNVVCLLISRNARVNIESCMRFRYTDL